jgi:phosphate transport system permease protein
MRLSTRKLLDRSFSSVGVFSLLLMCASLVVILGPIVVRGLGAFVFRETVEGRRAMLELFGRGDAEALKQELEQVRRVRQPVYDAIQAHEEDLWLVLEEVSRAPGVGQSLREKLAGREESLRDALHEFDYALGLRDEDALRKLDELEEAVAELEVVKEEVRQLLGPLPWESLPTMERNLYGETRWDRATVTLHDLLYRTEYDYSDPQAMGTPMDVPRVQEWRGTPLEPLFGHVEANVRPMLRPRWKFYWRFLFDTDVDAYFFGGIWPAVAGTFYLTFCAIVIAAPVGVISAIYLTQYAGESWFISLIRTCIGTLAGVPSIVFGLFGLALFVSRFGMPKSAVVGSLTLALLVLPTVIRASEEAIRAVPRTYKEASLSLGATRWRTIVTVILPAGLPGIITSIIISMGRAAGETAPILFTAAVALGPALKPWEIFGQRTQALPSNIYSMVAEHQLVEEIRHVQFGMAFTLVGLVLMLNLVAIWMRARISRKLRG